MTRTLRTLLLAASLLLAPMACGSESTSEPATSTSATIDHELSLAVDASGCVELTDDGGAEMFSGCPEQWQAGDGGIVYTRGTTLVVHSPLGRIQGDWFSLIATQGDFTLIDADPSYRYQDGGMLNIERPGGGRLSCRIDVVLVLRC